jgi:hypothetical protein
LRHRVRGSSLISASGSDFSSRAGSSIPPSSFSPGAGALRRSLGDLIVAVTFSESLQRAARAPARAGR